MAGSFTSWIRHLLTSAAPVKIFKRIYRYFRRFTLIRTVITVASYMITFIGTGVTFIIFSALFLIIMPIFAVLCFSLIFASLIDRKKVCIKMSSELKKKNTFVFFATRDNFRKRPFFVGNCVELSTQSSCAVIIVSPYYLSPKGIYGKKFFFSVREEAENIYIVRRYAFFYLRKRVLDLSDGLTVYFY